MINVEDIKYEFLNIDDHGISHVRYYVDGGNSIKIGFKHQSGGDKPSDEELKSRIPYEIFDSTLRARVNEARMKGAMEAQAKAQQESFNAMKSEILKSIGGK